MRKGLSPRRGEGRAGWLLIVLAVLSFLFVPSHAEAARFSGAYLLQVCEKDEKGREKVPGGHATCQSYIAGVIDYHNVLASLKIAPKIDICIPQKTSFNALQDIVLNYLRKHGEHDSFVAAPAVTMALYEVYPCK